MVNGLMDTGNGLGNAVKWLRDVGYGLRDMGN
jgi:hypothetical protein